MADIYQSSLFEPTAPPENVFQKPIKKKPPKIVGEADLAKEKKTSGTSSPSRPSHTLAPFLEYFTKRRKINNNNNNNNNNNRKLNQEHSSKDPEARGNSPHPKIENGGKRFSFFRGKQISELSANESTKDAATSQKEETTLAHNPEIDAKEPESLEPQAKDDNEVLCHGMLEKTETIGQKCLLSHLSTETDSDSNTQIKKSTDHELLVTVGKNSTQTRSDENDVALKYEKFVDTSEMQEHLNNINLKRCKDAMMPQSICATATLPAHSEHLSIPPVIEEVEESSVEEPPVIEVFLPQRESSVKQPSGIEPMQGLDGSLGTHNNVKKRRKLRHILRHFLNVNNGLRKEDKQRLVEDEEDDDEEEEQATVETAIDGQGNQGDKECQLSKTPSTQDNTDTSSPEKKKLPGAKVMSR